MVNTPSPIQKQYALDATTVSIGHICDCWDAAVTAAWDRGYQIRIGEQAVSKKTKGAHGDPTGNKGADSVEHPDRAEKWIASVRRELSQLLRLSGTDSAGRWTGAFDPPKLRQALIQAAKDIVDTWPLNTQKLLSRLDGLASEAMCHWPPTPVKGAVIDGVKVLEHYNPVEMCAECGGTIGANAADPLRRVDGKPYHKQTCYDTVRQRKLRASKRAVAPNPIGRASA